MAEVKPAATGRGPNLRVLTDKYYEPVAGSAHGEGFLSELMTYGRGYKANGANGVNVRKGWIDGCYSGEDNKPMQAVWVANLASASTLERPVMTYRNEVQLEFVYCDPCLLATVKPVSERECDMDAAAETT
jgi:hypothetical protein